MTSKRFNEINFKYSSQFSMDFGNKNDFYSKELSYIRLIYTVK